MSLSLDVALGERSYPIWIGAGLLDDGARWIGALGGRHVLVVSNDVVAPLYLPRIVAALDGFTHASFVLADGEAEKTLDNAGRVFAALGALGANRDACIIALGGGVVGDLAGFAAACWMRGIDFIQMPTTLLAMVDSSVGGKTGVNLDVGKNLVGAFHQPRAVVIDTSTLATLPDRQYAAGLAEVVKYGALGDAAFFAWLESKVTALMARDEAVLAEVIARCCAQKAGVVARDEFEHGERALLNFGHTFGHAIEAEAGYGAVLHGEAVAIGMCLAAQLSSERGLAGVADADRLRDLLRALALPVVPCVCNTDALVARMRLDKKNLSGRLRLILWRGIGKAEIVDGVDEAQVRASLDRAMAHATQE